MSSSVTGAEETRGQAAREELGDYQVRYCQERVHLDIFGSFLESHTSMKYVLMINNQFTKWVMCLPLLDPIAEAIAKVFHNQFICIFGCPVQIHTDQGRNFDGNYFMALCELIQVAKTRTTTYQPIYNGHSSERS